MYMMTELLFSIVLATWFFLASYCALGFVLAPLPTPPPLSLPPKHTTSGRCLTAFVADCRYRIVSLLGHKFEGFDCAAHERPWRMSGEMLQGGESVTRGTTMPDRLREEISFI